MPKRIYYSDIFLAKTHDLHESFLLFLRYILNFIRFGALHDAMLLNFLDFGTHCRVKIIFPSLIKSLIRSFHQRVSGNVIQYLS